MSDQSAEPHPPHSEPSTKHHSSATVNLIGGISLLVLLSLVITVYAGMMTQRWSPFTGLDEAKKLLQSLPTTIGDWEMAEELPMSQTDIDTLNIENAYVSRRYRNMKTQADVHFTMMVGPTGFVVVHTPEICFGGRDYVKDGTRTRKTIPLEFNVNDSFWQVSFTNQQIGGGTIMFYYAVSSGTQWDAVEKPRSAFSKFRYVYKIQLQSMVTNELDGVEQFLFDCLPTIHDAMTDCR